MHYPQRSSDQVWAKLRYDSRDKLRGLAGLARRLSTIKLGQQGRKNRVHDLIRASLIEGLILQHPPAKLTVQYIPKFSRGFYEDKTDFYDCVYSGIKYGLYYGQ